MRKGKKDYVNLNEDDLMFVSLFCYSNISLIGRLVGRK